MYVGEVVGFQFTHPFIRSRPSRSSSLLSAAHVQDAHVQTHLYIDVLPPFSSYCPGLACLD